PVAAAPVTATVVPTGTTIYVDNSVDGPGTGTAEDPYTLLGDALAVVEAGDTIMVAEGVYGPSSGETLPFVVPSHVTIIGEYDDEVGWLTMLAGWGVVPFGVADVPDAPIMVLGEEPILEPRDVTATEIAGAVGVVLHNLAFVGNATYGMGAGIVAYESELSVDNCLFEGLVAERGSAMFVLGSDVTVTRSVFAYNGGGMSDRAATTDELPFGIDRDALRLDKIPARGDVDAQIVEGAYYGGAVLSAYGDLSVSDTLFVDNAAMIAGGAILTDSGTCSTDRSLFLGNYTRGERIGSLAVEDAEVGDYVSALIDNGIYVEPFGGGAVCNLMGEYAADSSYYIFNEGDPGAAVVTLLGSTELDRCGIGMNWGAAVVAFGEEIIFNEVQALDYGMGAQQLPEPVETWSGLDIDRSEFFDNDGYYTVYSSSSPTRITNSVFAGNWAWAVAGVENSDELNGVEIVPEPLPVFEASIEGCTFSRNFADYAMVHGSKYDYLPLINSIIWDNGDNEWTAAWDASNVHAFNVDYEDEISAGIEQDCFSEDPLFLDAEEYDFRLWAASPCIDTGTDAPMALDTTAAEAVLSWDLRPWDVRNLGRPVDGDGDGEALYDVGAHEYLPSARAGGADRFETSVLVSEQHFGQADTVVIATGRTFADGLSGSGLAGILGAPILLTEPDALPAVVVDDIMRLGASRAIILGGTDAVGPAVEAALLGLGLEVERIGGIDRYETSALIAERIAEAVQYSAIFSGPLRMAFIARGDLFADALAVSPVAYANQAPVLLVKPDELPDHTVDILTDMGITEAVVLGGQTAVDKKVAVEVAALVSDVERIDGANRYETAANIAEWAWENGFATFEITGVATGDDFADALSGGAGIGSTNGVLLLTPRDTAHPACVGSITAHADEILGLMTFGGPNAISSAVYNQLMALLAF
ncbi:MAG: cell wall-binding repeat-containing protein, partial [Coriobacteriia bacterium]|nr:cell wall-binding repeat-containing protein [Coriobacteriia bacterium]